MQSQQIVIKYQAGCLIGRTRIVDTSEFRMIPRFFPTVVQYPFISILKRINPFHFRGQGSIIYFSTVLIFKQHIQIESFPVQISVHISFDFRLHIPTFDLIVMVIFKSHFPVTFNINFIPGSRIDSSGTHHHQSRL